jgi:hypothetical protein
MLELIDRTVADNEDLPLMFRITEGLQCESSPVDKVMAERRLDADKYDPVTQVAYRTDQEIIAKKPTNCQDLTTFNSMFSFDEISNDVHNDD